MVAALPVSAAQASATASSAFFRLAAAKTVGPSPARAAGAASPPNATSATAASRTR